MRALLALVLCAAALAAAAPAALADADPPSDVLLLQSVYYPYQPPVSDKLRRTLDRVVATSQKAGYPVKVAMVESTVDLGAIPQLFGRPAEYAPFLGREIAFKTKDPLLVIMPAATATYNVTAKAQQAIQGIKIDTAKRSDGLVAAAIEAVPKMATASGHPVAAVPVPSGAKDQKAGGGTSPLIVFGAPVILVALAALVAALRRRGEGEDEDQDGGDEDEQAPAEASS